MIHSVPKGSTTFAFFRAHKKGNVSIMLGLLIVPLMLSIGFAIDFLRLTNYRSKAAETLDIALLVTAQQYAYDKTINVNAVTQDYMNKSWNSSDPIPTVNTTVNEDTNNITGTINSTIPTTFMAVAGKETMGINISAEVTANTKNLELVLVLDNTGSMNNNNKIATLRSAATDLVTTVMPENAAETLANVKVSIVPFSQYVNVGTDKAGQDWLSIPTDSTPDCWHEVIHPEMCTPGTPGEPTTCTNTEGETYTCYTGGTSRNCPPESYGPEICEPSSRVWDGCVGSRATPLNMKDDTYSTKIPGIFTDWSGYCPSPITALTDTQSTITTAIAAMSGNKVRGTTYIPHGLMWGWRVLSNEKPFDQGVAYNDIRVTKVMVLMTDGDNTIYPTYPKHGRINGHADRKAIADGFTAEACVKIKAKGIKIYTVAFEVTDATTKALLQTCATEPSNYYDASSSEGLRNAFKDITRELINLRVAK